MSDNSRTISLSIIVPCYNEEKNIPLILERFKEVVGTRADVEVLLVNNGSSDNSTKVFKAELSKSDYNFARVVNVEHNQGYGFGILQGLKESKGDVLAWTHADMQTDPKDVLTAYEAFLASHDNNIIIKGKRTNRKFGQWAFTLGMSCIASIVLIKRLYDINAQPKLFGREFYITYMESAPHDFSLDLFLLYVAQTKGYTINTIPVRFPDRVHGESTWAFSFRSRVKIIWRTIKYIFALRKQVKQL